MLQPQPIRSDHEVQRDVTDTLQGDVRVDETSLNVQVKGGVVHLRGAVPSLFQKSMARQLVERIKGVNEVINELQVTPVEERSDAILKEDIEGALKRDAFIDERGITVEAKHGVVTLSGAISSYTERAAAEDVARLVVGVKEVINHLVVAPPPVA